MKTAFVQLTLIFTITMTAAFAEPALDSDGDGIPDAQDQCSQTVAGAKVWTSGPWAGCTEGQRRDSDLATAILKCEDTADSQIAQVHIYTPSSCESFGYRLNEFSGPYVNMTASVVGRRLSTLGNEYLSYRLNYCNQVAANVAQTISDMKASGCDPGTPVYSYHSAGNYSSGGGSSSYSGGSSGNSSGFFHHTLGSTNSYTSTGGGGFVSSNGTSYTPTGSGYVSSNGTSYTAVGGSYLSSTGTLYTPVGGGNYISSGGSH